MGALTPWAVGMGIAALVGIIGGVVGWFVLRGERPVGQWVEVVMEPTEPGAQDVVGFASIDVHTGKVKTVYCANCAPMLRRWASWPIRRWSRGACSRCVVCAMRLGEITLAGQDRGNGDKAGGLSVVPPAPTPGRTAGLKSTPKRVKLC